METQRTVLGGLSEREEERAAMNRQQRRLIAQKRAVEKKIESKIIRAGEVEVELFFTAFGLALEELHGFKRKRITKVWKRTDEIISEISNGEATFDMLKNRLKMRAGIECSFR